MKFGRVVDARRAVWEVVLSELDHVLDLGVLEDECEDEFDLRRMEAAIKQVRASIRQRILKS